MTSIIQKFNQAYDTANRLTSVNGQAVQWDDNGNMLADGQAVYTYNTANKLVGVTKGTSNIVYTYSGLGDRLKQIADGVTTDYTLDINAGLTQVLDDGTNKYLYGNQRISQIAETQTGYFLPDALGSIRQMTDPSADLTLARTYDPYGNVVSSSGAGETVYGYTGEMQSNGLVHLRARDYASQLGRFASRDTWEGDPNRPFSDNKWNYGFSNPINYTDPSGNFPPEYCASLLLFAVADGPVPALDSIPAICYVFLVGAPIMAQLASSQAPEVADDLDTACENMMVWIVAPSTQPTPNPKPSPSPKPVPAPYDPVFPSVPTGTPEPRFTLFHYTKAENIPNIIATGLKPSVKIPDDPSSDAQWGDGQYFTDLTPLEATTSTRYKVSYALYKFPYKLGRGPNYLPKIGWIEIDARKLPVSRVSGLYGTNFPGRSIYLNRSHSNLPISDKLIQTGIVEFKSDGP